MRKDRESRGGGIYCLVFWCMLVSLLCTTKNSNSNGEISLENTLADFRPDFWNKLGVKDLHLDAEDLLIGKRSKDSALHSSKSKKIEGAYPMTHGNYLLLQDLGWKVPPLSLPDHKMRDPTASKAQHTLCVWSFNSSSFILVNLLLSTLPTTLLTDMKLIN